VPSPSYVPLSYPFSVAVSNVIVKTSLADLDVVRNGELSQSIPVRYESLAAPRLAELRSRENLDAVIAGASDEFDVMLRLKDWVAAQWLPGTPIPYPPWDAVTVLDWIRSGVTGGHCGQYSQVLLQALAALGYRARYVELGSIDNPYAHFVTEVWSSQFDKWVVLDADFNVHFERAGVPLSALEVHDALTRGELSDVVTVRGSVRHAASDPDHWPLLTAELYYYLRVHLKADHLTMPNENPFDRYNDMIEWRSALTVPWEQSTMVSPYRKEALTNLATSDRSLLESKLHQVLVTVESVDLDGDSVALRFDNNVFEFLRYQIRELNGEWRDYDGSNFIWSPSAIESTLEVRAANVSGVVGPSSVVAARLEVEVEVELEFGAP
jgi:hypothetical protein